jgi:hypothetical protein
MQARFDARLQAAARKGPTARETNAATDHRQPTPESIAAAESRIGDISPGVVRVIETGMARAREADAADDRTVCEQALAEVQRALGP